MATVANSAGKEALDYERPSHGRRLRKLAPSLRRGWGIL